MISRYYQEELKNLRTLGVEFARAHPALAPMLGEASADPDVERLLEGVAFLTGLVRGKLDDDFPEIVQGLAQMLFPHYLRPVPALSVVAFAPKAGLHDTHVVKAGTQVASVPVEGTECLFRTTQAVEVHPLRLTGAELRQSVGRPDEIHLAFELKGQSLSRWKPTELSFFLAASYAEASNLLLLLTRHLRRILLRPLPDGPACELDPSALVQTGLDLDNGLLPYPAQAFRGYRLVQEYMVLPQKFLFLALRGWDRWKDRGAGSTFEVVLELAPGPVPPPRLKPEHIALFATPVVNLFPFEADPVLVDHRRERIRVRPAGSRPGHQQVFSLDKVTGLAQGTLGRREYVPLGLFSRQASRPVYQTSFAPSPTGQGSDLLLSLAYDGQDARGPVTETLSMLLTCTNGALPQRLQLGEICRPTEETGELVTFRNLLPVTPAIEPELGGNLLWRLLGHLTLNFLSLADTASLRELLRLYLLPGMDRTLAASHAKRLEGLVAFTAQPEDRLVRGTVVRGHRILLQAREDCFASLGDLHCFGSVLDLLLGVFASLNSHTQFTLKESMRGETFTWPARTGTRPLI